MKVTNVTGFKGTDREVSCPKGAFTSNRILLAKDGMGYTMTKTVINKGGPYRWHYKNHLETCYCVSGSGKLTDLNTGKTYEIVPDKVYVLDQYDPHTFEAYEETVLLCVFNPPLTGKEVHKEDGSYERSF